MQSTYATGETRLLPAFRRSDGYAFAAVVDQVHAPASASEEQKLPFGWDAVLRQDPNRLTVVLDPIFDPARESCVEVATLYDPLASWREDQFSSWHLFDELFGSESMQQGCKLRLVNALKGTAAAKDIMQVCCGSAAGLAQDAEYLMNTRTKMKAIVFRWFQPTFPVQLQQSDRANKLGK
jgi:hypothetical protein